MPIIESRKVEMIEWALGAMEDYWGEEGQGGADEYVEDSGQEWAGPYTMPRLDGRALDLTGVDPMVVEDMIHRLKIQLADIDDDNAEFSPGQRRRQNLAREALVEELETALKGYGE